MRRLSGSTSTTLNQTRRFEASAIDSSAQVELKTYADANGYIDVQALTCAQLAGTFQEDADLLTTWYSGWYNGLAKKHFINLARSKEAEHETIVFCKANPDQKIIKVIGMVFDKMRTEKGIVLAKYFALPGRWCAAGSIS